LVHVPGPANLTAVAIVPSTPLLVPQLCGAGGVVAETAPLREAALRAVAALPVRWVAVGVGSAARVDGPDATGTFAGYGVDVPVTLSATATGAADALPLCALITGWLRGVARPEATAAVHTYPAELPADAAIAAGRALRAELDTGDGPVGALIVADGANTLTASAPGGHDPATVPVQAALDAALAGGDVAALAGLPEVIVGRVAYQVLAGLAPAPRSVRELFRGAPYGVGYFCGQWLL
jgi:hypothetical protein